MKKLTFVGATASVILITSCLTATPLFAQENPRTQSNIGFGPAGVHQLRAWAGPNPGQVVLSWVNAYPDVANYNLLYGTVPGNFQYGAVNIGKVTSYTVNYLAPGETYYFAISPVRNGKAQFVSLQVSSQPKEGTVTPPPATATTSSVPTASLTTIPKNDLAGTQNAADINDKPTGFHNLTAKKGDKPGQVTLSWKQAYNDVDNYSVVYGTEPGKFSYGALNVGKTNSYIVSGLTPGTKYYFALVPSKGGKSIYITSQVSEDPTPGVVETPVAVAPAPTVAVVGTAKDSYTAQDPKTISSKPTGAHQLTATKNGKGEVTLSWKQADANTDNYDIVYGTEPGKFQYGALNVGKTNSYTVKGLDPNKHYYFAIAPVKGGKAQYITQQVSDTAAPVVLPPAPSQNNEAVQTGAPSAPGTSGTVPSPTSGKGKTTPQAPAGKGKESDNSSSKPAAPAKSVSQPSKQNPSKPGTKKVENSKVKGASTSLSPGNVLVDWLKKLFLR